MTSCFGFWYIHTRLSGYPHDGKRVCVSDGMNEQGVFGWVSGTYHHLDRLGPQDGFGGIRRHGLDRLAFLGLLGFLGRRVTFLGGVSLGFGFGYGRRNGRGLAGQFALFQGFGTRRLVLQQTKRGVCERKT